MKNKTRIPKDMIFFDFSKTLKRNKDRILKLKNFFLKHTKNTWKDQKFCS